MTHMEIIYITKTPPVSKTGKYMNMTKTGKQSIIKQLIPAMKYGLKNGKNMISMVI